MNLSRVAWRLDVQPPLRAGQTATVGLALRNGKKFLPTYGLWFEWAARPLADPGGGSEGGVHGDGQGHRRAGDFEEGRSGDRARPSGVAGAVGAAR